MNNKNSPLLILALAAILLGWLFYKDMGGIEGMRRDPQQALFVGGLALVVIIPLFWFRYRKLQRETPYVPAPEPELGAPPDARLGSMPLVVVASRAKVLGLLGLLVVAFAVIGAVMWGQPGLCRTVGLASYGAFFLWGFVLSIAGLILPERLEIAPWGLKHVSPWRTRHWPWEEVRNITAITAFGGAWVSGFFFNRYVSPLSEPGSPRPTFRAIWSMPAGEITRLLNDARLRWTPAGTSHLVPATGRPADYLRVALTFGAAGLMILILMLRPCGS